MKGIDEFVQLVAKGRVPPVIVRLIFPSFTDKQYGCNAQKYLQLRSLVDLQ